MERYFYESGLLSESEVPSCYDIVKFDHGFHIAVLKKDKQ